MTPEIQQGGPDINKPAIRRPDPPGVAEDLNDTAAGGLKEFFKERSAIIEHDGGMARLEQKRKLQ